MALFSAQFDTSPPASHWDISSLLFHENLMKLREFSRKIWKNLIKSSIYIIFGCFSVFLDWWCLKWCWCKTLIPWFELLSSAPTWDQLEIETFHPSKLDLDPEINECIVREMTGWAEWSVQTGHLDTVQTSSAQHRTISASPRVTDFKSYFDMWHFRQLLIWSFCYPTMNTSFTLFFGFFAAKIWVGLQYYNSTENIQAVNSWVDTVMTRPVFLVVKLNI